MNFAVNLCTWVNFSGGMQAVKFYFEKIKFDLPGNRVLKYTSSPWGKNAGLVCFGLQEVQRDCLNRVDQSVLVYSSEHIFSLTAKELHGPVNLCTSFFGQSSPKIKSSLIKGGGTDERDDFDDDGSGGHVDVGADDDGWDLVSAYGLAGDYRRLRWVTM